ncbi:TetR/AcrR family transcriptional regulator [bacterium]|nr:MAG: TetR/AcrR family transcriptional regulator [bacterium]
MNVVAPTSPDPRVRRTRKALQDALGELLREKRFAEISVQDVAERSTVNRATFYAHFRDKHDLLASLLKAQMGGILRGKLPSDAALNRESLTAVAMAVLEFLGDVHQQCPASAKDFEDLTDMALQGEIYELIYGWIGEARPKPYPGHSDDAVATMISWTLFGAAHRWSQGDRKQPPESVAKAAVALLLP